MRRTFLLASLLSTFGAVFAQCPDCEPDAGCTISPAYPTLCPTVPPDATVGIPYSTVITFWLPPSFTDPGSGFTVDFEQMTITGVAGLPFGLGVSYSHPSGVYYPQQEQHGCAHICGTPLLAGTYPVTISILAGVNYNGISLSVPQDFTLQLTVLPGSGGNTGFTFTPTTGCGSVSVAFQALIDGSPAPTGHVWDFGDGSAGETSASPVHLFEGPGAYAITLETTIGGYVLNEVHLTGVNGNWCGDVEEPNLPFLGCQGSPDPYFVLTDGQGNAHTSSTVDNSFTASWTGLGLPMNTPPYSISFYDEDAVSQDDLLGTFNVPTGGAGTYNFNVAGGTTGHLIVGEQVQQQFTHTDTVVVFPLPEAVLAEDTLTGQLCVSTDSLASYVWFLNGDTVPDHNSACVPAFAPGVWQVEVTNPFGCTAMSNTWVVCPSIAIVHNGPVLQVPSGFLSYAWTFQGNPVGGNDPFAIIIGDGVYTVTVTDANGCTITAAYDLMTMGITGQESAGPYLAVFPVPNSGQFTVVADRLAGRMAEVRILDAVGRVVKAIGVPVVNGTLRLAVNEPLPAGSYLVQVAGGSAPATARFVVH